MIGPVSRALSESAAEPLDHLLRRVDPAVVLASSRILGRVIREELGLTGFWSRVPHRKSFVIARDRLWEIVARDELSLDPADELPDTVILLPRPRRDDPFSVTRPQLLRRYWRLLFHAAIHRALDERIASGRLSPDVVQSRIREIGRVPFEEITNVLRHEALLPPNDTPMQAYVEFAAVYSELRSFAPHLLPMYFPSLRDPQCVERILSQDVAADELLETTRVPGSAKPIPRRQRDAKATAPVVTTDALYAGSLLPVQLSRSVRRLWMKADTAAGRGNAVRASVLRMRAARSPAVEDKVEGLSAALAELERLLHRLQDALELSDHDVPEWREALTWVLAGAVSGYWNPNARLLYDLQAVCVDHEREVSNIDLFGFLRSWGRRPLRRPLPGQRLVLILKHLQRASHRLAAVGLQPQERLHLSQLLQAAIARAEHQLREQTRPWIVAALEEVGLVPRNVPERVAFHKLVEELLDGIVQRGFLNMGDLRDAISRNQLKLADVSGVQEFILGDPLLRADQRLGQRLEGVYRRGEFYLHWLQRLSSLAFGTAVGRWATRYLILPFGGAYVVVEGVQHLVGPAVRLLTGYKMHVSSPAVMAVIGMFFFGLMHVPAFRRQVQSVLRTIGQTLWFVLIELPRRTLNLPPVRLLLSSRAVALFRRYVANALLITALLALVLPRAGLYRLPTRGEAALLFLGLLMVLNSRTGRALEEFTVEWLERSWRLLRVHVLSALFNLVMETFKQLLDLVDKLLYSVDEWLRFKSGESALTLGVKAVLGLAWGVVIFVVRLYVTLLIEPQVNPIKHFPVVTVSHKLILPFSLMLARLMAAPIEPVLGKFLANTIAGTTVFLLPGIFGFLVWELRENWRLYAANRAKTLQPVPVGHHGETLPRLLRPGFHSGTVPKLYAKLRRAAGSEEAAHKAAALEKSRERLAHVAEAVRHFVERELLALLRESRSCRDLPLRVGGVQLATNSLHIDLVVNRGDERTPRLVFEEQSGWIIAHIAETDALAQLSREQRQVLENALAGFYALSGVQLIRERVEQLLPPHTDYGFEGPFLILRPDRGSAQEIRIELRPAHPAEPPPESSPVPSALERLRLEQIVFSEHPLSWTQWVADWEQEQRGDQAAPPSRNNEKKKPHRLVEPTARTPGT